MTFYVEVDFNLNTVNFGRKIIVKGKEQNYGLTQEYILENSKEPKMLELLEQIENKSPDLGRFVIQINAEKEAFTEFFRLCRLKREKCIKFNQAKQAIQ